MRKGKLRDLAHIDPQHFDASGLITYFNNFNVMDLMNVDGWRKFLAQFFNPSIKMNVTLRYVKYRTSNPDLVVTVWKWGARKKHTKIDIFEMRVLHLTDLGKSVMNGVTNGTIIEFEL